MTDTPSSGASLPHGGIPPEFNDVEFMQSMLRTYINREILQHFSDLGDETWQPHIGTSRAAMRVALTHKDDDSLLLSLLRMFFYYFTYGQARALQTPVYGIPIPSYQESVVHLPQVKLFFLEPQKEVEFPNPAVTAEITFRLVGETSESMTEAKAEALAHKIQRAFAGSKRFTWRKGHLIATYRDKPKGYDFKLYVRDETEVRRVIERVLDIQNHAPDWENLSISESKRHFSSTAPTKRIYGKTRRLPRRRPLANVRFYYADLHIWGLPNPITLVDCSGYRNPIVSRFFSA